MKEKYILLVNEDKTWALLEESEVAGIQDDGKDFAVFHIGPETPGSKIAGIMQELFSHTECITMPIAGRIAGMSSLQESFIYFLKMKKGESDA